jgi:hypothetical protein
MPLLPLDRRGFFTRCAQLALACSAGRAIEPTVRAAKEPSPEENEAGLRASDPDRCGPFSLGSVIYRNPLATAEDVRNFRLEGSASATFPNRRLRLENRLDDSLGQKSNFVFWFDAVLPASFAASWDFWPVREPGLCMVLFAARSRQGGDIFHRGLKTRTGEYAQYHHGDIDLLHLSYFRRKAASERAFHVCNLRKSYGFTLVAEGADPLPSVADASPPYRIELIKSGPVVAFFINRMPVLRWHDDGMSHGRVLSDGRFAFRQMAPLVGEYSNFVVRDVTGS